MKGDEYMEYILFALFSLIYISLVIAGVAFVNSYLRVLCNIGKHKTMRTAMYFITPVILLFISYLVYITIVDGVNYKVLTPVMAFSAALGIGFIYHANSTVKAKNYYDRDKMLLAISSKNIGDNYSAFMYSSFASLKFVPIGYTQAHLITYICQDNIDRYEINYVFYNTEYNYSMILNEKNKYETGTSDTIILKTMYGKPSEMTEHDIDAVTGILDRCGINYRLNIEECE